MRVLITDSLSPPADEESKELEGLATVEILRCRNSDELDEALAEADGVIVYHEVSITEKTIARMKHCKVIVRGGVGYDNVDIVAAATAGIPVCNIPDYGVDEVADHALTMILALNRGFANVERRLRHTLSPWGREAIGPTLRLSEATLGIVGCGRTGSALAVRARALKMDVVICDPYQPRGIEKVFGARRCNLDELLAVSDFVSLHTPLTDETRQMINAKTLAKMKQTAMLINTSRGSVVDTDAVAEALAHRKIGGAALDVLATEPPNAEMKLIALWQDKTSDANLIITPHTAYYSGSAVREIRRKGAREVARVLRGETPLNRVN